VSTFLVLSVLDIGPMYATDRHTNVRHRDTMLLFFFSNQVRDLYYQTRTQFLDILLGTRAVTVDRRYCLALTVRIKWCADQ